MCDLIATFFGVVDGHSCGLVRTFLDVSARITCCVAEQAKGPLGAIGRGDGNGLSAAIDFLNGTFGCLQTIRPNVVNFFGGVYSPFGGVTHHNLTAFLEPMHGVLRSSANSLDTMDGSAFPKMKGAFGTVLRCDEHGLSR